MVKHVLRFDIFSQEAPSGVIKCIHTCTNPEEDKWPSPGWQPTDPMGNSGLKTYHYYVAWCLIWQFANIEKSMVIHDTECLYWDQISLNNTKLTLLGRWASMQPVTLIQRGICAPGTHYYCVEFLCPTPLHKTCQALSPRPLDLEIHGKPLTVWGTKCSRF